MNRSTHTKHAFIPWAPHTHALLSRIRDFLPALRTVQRFDGRAPRRAPARHAASYAALSCHSCSTGSGCPALAPGGLAESQPFASATPQPHAARMLRGGREERDVDRAAGRRRARGWASRPRQPRQRSRGRARAAPASSRPPPVRPASIEQRHGVSHGTRRRIGGGAGKACGSTGMAAHL